MYAIDFNYPFEFETTVIKHLTTTSKKKRKHSVCGMRTKEQNEKRV